MAIEPVSISQLERSPEEAYGQGLAVLDMTANGEAMWLIEQAGSFAMELAARQAARDTSSPHRVMPMQPADVTRMEEIGTGLAECVAPLTKLRVTTMLRGRFLLYDAPDDATSDHIDQPLDDDHVLTFGVNATGRGILEAWSYTRSSTSGQAERVPILLTPGIVIVQRNISPVEHIVRSLDAGRTAGIWDLAAA